jgi:hypothetical protein
MSAMVALQMLVVPKLEFSLEKKEVSEADKFIANVRSLKRKLLH